MAKVKELLDNLRNDVESVEREFVVDCLKEAVKYCYEQYRDNGGEVDPLPSVKKLGLSDEEDKYILVNDFLSTLIP